MHEKYYECRQHFGGRICVESIRKVIVDWRIILKCTLKEYDVGISTGLVWFMTRNQ
jgi:hypothetical protein